MRRLRHRSSAHHLDLEALYAGHGEALLVFLTRRTADAQIALDLWAETWAQAHASRANFRGESGMEAAGWIYGIARHQLALFYRRGEIERRALARLELERPTAPPQVVDQLERAAGLEELRQELAAALAALSPAVREAVQLRIVEELDYAGVAARLGVSEGTARVRVSRGLAGLADLLDHQTIAEQLA